MHKEVEKFIRSVKKEFPHKFRNKKVLEVGSQNINGSPRKFFRNWWDGSYTGIDIYNGKGVDLVTSIQFVWDKFDTIVSTEMLEHSESWAMDLKGMYDRLYPGGLLIITCAGPHRAEHGTKRTSPECSPGTTDYYRNITIEDFQSVLSPGMFDPYVLQYARGMSDLQFYGIKWHPNNKQIYHELIKTAKT